MRTARKRPRRIAVSAALAAVLAIAVLAGCGAAGTQSTDASVTDTTTQTGGIELVKLSNATSKFDKVYTSSYQKSAHAKVAALKKEKSRTLDDPLVVANPYGTIVNGLYVYFQTDAKCAVRYTVSCDGFADFSRTVESGAKGNLAKEHEWMLVGCVAGQENTVKLETLDKNGKTTGEKTFTYSCPKAYSESAKTQLKVTKGTSKDEVADGLYTVFGDEASTSKYLREVDLYDNSGVLRAEMPVPNYRTSRFLFKGGELYYAPAHAFFVRMDRTGYIDKFYQLGSKVEYHHDYIWGKEGDILFLGSDISKGRNSKEDRVCSLNVKTGKVKTLVDLKKVFPKYFSKVRAANTVSRLDWAHLNSIDFIGSTKDIVVSSRETSTLIAFKNPYKKSPTKPSYMIGSKKFWKGTGYAKYLLKKKGSGALTGGQHTITFDSYVKGSKTKYYLSMYDNNSLFSDSRPDYNWKADPELANSQAGYTKSNKDGGASYYYRYLVDTKAKTVKRVKKIKVAYSLAMGSTQSYGGHIIIGSSHSNVFYEYGSDGKLVQSEKTGFAKRFYRAFKYDFDGFWFA